MVLCDGALVVNLVASVMMNGVCCLHNMHEEEEKKRDHRETLKKAIQVEWQRQRLLDEEQKRKDLDRIRAEERRRSLMMAKLKAKSFFNEDSTDESTVAKSLPPITKKRRGLESPSMVMAQRRVRSEPIQHHQARMIRTQSRRQSELSSLFDEDEDDDESLVDVALQ